MTAVRIRAGSEHIWNFCYKIKTYHEKRREQQFYDFTIKDEDGVAIQAHKFILASQSEYFASLFRVNPAASETTFQDFSLDAIKSSIDYLYTHEVNLTGSNAQDVLTFADFINLTDVIDICTSYIIRNIDESNYVRVMEIGDSRGLDRLVESGVLFVVRNLSPQTNFDDFTQSDDYESCTLAATATDYHDKETMAHQSTEKQIYVNTKRAAGLPVSLLFGVE